MTDLNDLSKYQLCKLTGKPKKIIDDWVALGCPHRKVGDRYSFKFAEVFTWREAYLTEKAKKKEWSDTRFALEEQRIRIIQERTKKLEWENERMREQLVDPKEAAKVWEKATQAASKKCLAIAPMLAGRLADESNPAVCKEIMDEAIYDLLMDLAGSDNGE